MWDMVIPSMGGGGGSGCEIGATMGVDTCDGEKNWVRILSKSFKNIVSRGCFPYRCRIHGVRYPNGGYKSITSMRFP
jgi:hypothetical protein